MVLFSKPLKQKKRPNTQVKYINKYMHPNILYNLDVVHALQPFGHNIIGRTYRIKHDTKTAIYDSSY